MRVFIRRLKGRRIGFGWLKGNWESRIGNEDTY